MRFAVHILGLFARVALCFAWLCAAPLAGQEVYQKAPPPIPEILDAPATPTYSGGTIVYPAPPPVVQTVQLQRQVCYPHGCYYLNGDGYYVAYQWVWVPAPPPSAPPPPVPAAPPLPGVLTPQAPGASG